MGEPASLHAYSYIYRCVSPGEIKMPDPNVSLRLPFYLLVLHVLAFFVSNLYVMCLLRRDPMEEEMLSVISHGEVNSHVEVSDSSSIMRVSNKQPRHGGNGSSSKFKGVVPLHNGNWGAQIYSNQQRIWLGTFKSETVAAMSYDSAAVKLRNGDCHRNFPWNTVTAQEPKFQSHYSVETVMNMIRDGSYHSKFMDFLRGSSGKLELRVDLNPTKAYKKEGLLCKQLFHKELTPSDVGKLNRLVIPKKYALKYFPPISAVEDDGKDDSFSRVNDTELAFYDRSLKQWRFRYCFWASSQSYVFTRGWNRFVKDKNLKAGDVTAFYTCENQYGEGGEGGSFFMIDVATATTVGEVSNQQSNIELDLQLHLGKENLLYGDAQDVESGKVKDGELAVEDLKPVDGRRGFKLFGRLII